MTVPEERPSTAVVICLPDARPERRLLGLSLGERLLLTLAAGGIARVAFVGDGDRPTCERAALDIVQLDQLDAESGTWLVASDAVFDRHLLATPEAVDDGPLRWLDGEKLPETLAALPSSPPDLAAGQASSGRGFAIRVTDKASRRAARRALLLSLRKPIDGLISRHLNRYVSTFISSRLVNTGVRPNHLTIVFTLVGLSSAVFAAHAEYWWSLVLAGALVQLQSILDGCDGEVARLTYRFSLSGQWLDSIGDDLTNYAFCLGLAIGQARVLDRPELYAAGVAVLLVQMLGSGILYRRLIKMGTGDLLAIPDVTTTPSGDGLWARFMRVLRLLFKRDSFVFMFAVLTAAQQALIAFFLFGLGSVMMAVATVLNERALVRMEANQ